MKKIIVCCCAFIVTGVVQAQKTAAGSKPKKVVKTVAKPAETKTFSNGITMTIKGFKVVKAGLFYEDETPVAEDNTIELNQKIMMYALLDSGYKVVNGKVFPGGSEHIVLSNGFEVLKTGDLFEAYDTAGVDPEDGKHILLKAKMTQLDDKRNSVNVSFKIWDKKSRSVITGSYKLFIK